MADPFHIRFNIDVPVEEAQRRFVNRMENRILKIMENASRFANTNLDSITIDVETTLGEPHLTYVGTSGVFIQVWRKRVDNDFSRCFRAIEGLYQALDLSFEKTQLNAAVNETLAQSETDLGIHWQEGIFARKGAGLLDEALVNEPLRWLTEGQYQNVRAAFEKGLKHFLEGEKEPERLADAVTDMYEATEAMAKIVTNRPAKDLSALREEFVSKISLPDAYKTILKEYIDYGCDYRHALKNKQPRKWPQLHEAEGFVYLTGLLIRLAMEARKSNSQP